MEIKKGGAISASEADDNKMPEQTVEAEEPFIPKHRYDCVNLSLKEHKIQVERLKKEIADLSEQNSNLFWRLNDAYRLQEENRLLRELLKLTLNECDPTKVYQGDRFVETKRITK